MIILFDDNETLFKGLGLGVLKDARDCYVGEELNDAFEFQMVYPITGQNYDKIRLNRIVFCKPSPYSKPQPFRIYRISKPINGLVTVDALHISYDMNGIPVNPIDGKTLKDALDKIQNGTLIRNNFHLYTDKTDTKTFKTTNVYNMRALLMGSSDSVLEKYEGELSFDNFNVYLLQRRGSNKGAQVRYAKNLKDITHEITYDRLYNGVYPYFHQETTSQSSSSTTDGFTQVYIVGSKPYQDGWLSYSQNGEPYHPVDESPVQVATEGNFYQKVYTWNTTTQRYSERIYNESVTLIDQVGNLLGSDNTPSWIYIDWSKLPSIVCKANTDGYFKSASESEWTYHKKGEIIFENSIKDAATNLILYYSEVVPITTTSKTEETTTVTHIELDNKIIYLDTDAAKEMKFDRILALDLSSEFQETPTKEQLEAKAKEYIEKHKIGQYKYNTTVSFVDLSTTTEGIQYENIEKIELGDTVKVIYDDLGVNIDLRVIKTQYNVLLDRYEKIELGEKPEKISGESIQNGDNVSSLTNDVGYANITTVNKLIAKTVTADYIKALNAQFSKAQIDELSTARIKVSGLIEATQFELDNLVAKMLTADNAVIKETLEAGTVKVKGDISIISGEITIEDSGKTKVFKVDREGNVTANAVKITGGELNINDTFTVSPDGILSAQGAQIEGNVEITSGSIELGTKFKVKEDGTVHASGVTISGNISADTGNIAGFVIDKDNVHGQYLRDVNSKIFISPEYNNITIDSVVNKKWTLIAGLSRSGSGASTTYSAKFKVATDGTVYATEAIITGKITSNDVTITGGSLNIGNNAFVVTNAGAVTATNIAITGGTLSIGNKFSVSNTGVLVANGARIQNGNINIVNGSIVLGQDIYEYVLNSLNELSVVFIIYTYNDEKQEYYDRASYDIEIIDQYKTNLVHRKLPQGFGPLSVGTTVPTFDVPFWEDESEVDRLPPLCYDTFWYVGTTEYYGITYDLWVRIEGDSGGGEREGWDTPSKRFLFTERSVQSIVKHPFEVDSNGNVYATSVTITGGSLHIQGSSAEFGVSTDGKLFAVEAEILGKITATSGYIGTSEKGFTITENAIYNGFDSLSSSALSGGVYIGTDGIRVGQDSTRTKTYWTTKTLYISGDHYLDITDNSYPNDNYEGGMFTLEYYSKTYKRVIKFTPVKQNHSALYDAKPIEVELPKDIANGELRTVTFSLTQSKWFAVRYTSDSSDTSMPIYNLKLATLAGFIVNRYGDVIMRDATVKGSFRGDVTVTSGSINIQNSGGTKTFSVSQNGELFANSGVIASLTISGNMLSYGSVLRIIATQSEWTDPRLPTYQLYSESARIDNLVLAYKNAQSTQDSHRWLVIRGRDSGSKLTGLISYCSDYETDAKVTGFIPTREFANIPMFNNNNESRYEDSSNPYMYMIYHTFYSGGSFEYAFGSNWNSVLGVLTSQMSTNSSSNPTTGQIGYYIDNAHRKIIFRVNTTSTIRFAILVIYTENVSV